MVAGLATDAARLSRSKQPYVAGRGLACKSGPSIVLVAAVVVILLARNLTAGLFLLLPLGGYRQLPAHQRRQVLGR